MFHDVLKKLEIADEHSWKCETKLTLHHDVVSTFPSLRDLAEPVNGRTHQPTYYQTGKNLRYVDKADLMTLYIYLIRCITSVGENFSLLQANPKTHQHREVCARYVHHHTQDGAKYIFL
jgi:hypothetical protein